jgi:hypothetical protein
LEAHTNYLASTRHWIAEHTTFIGELKMTQFVKRIDPAKVAQLSKNEYSSLWEIAEKLNNGVQEEDVPADLCAAAFHIMRNCGVSDLRCYAGMKIVAMQLNNTRMLIERLRK